MRKIRKIIILVLMTTFFLSTMVGAYAWFTLQPSTEALDLNARSTELISSSARVQLGSQTLDYNSSYYNQTEYAIQLTKSQITSNLNGSTFPLEINVLITALKTVNVRFKLVEVWTVNNVVQNKPNVFTWNYAQTNRIDNSGYYVHDQVLTKGLTPFDVGFITNASVNTSVLSGLSNNAVLKLSLVVSAVQANRSSNWNLAASNHVIKQFDVPSNISGQSLNVIFNGVSNPQYTRGVYVEFKSSTNNFSYIWHTRSALSNRLTLPAGTYDVRINLVNHLNFTVSRNGNTIEIQITYGPIPSWGLEDVLYAPSMVPTWQPNVTYKSGDMVYYDDLSGNGVNAGYYKARQASTGAEPDASPWAWQTISVYYSDTRAYLAGEIIYYNNKFYRAKANVWAGNPPPLAWAWELLGLEHETGKVYTPGDVAYTLSNDIKSWYVSYGSFTAHSEIIEQHYNLKYMSINYSEHNKGKYQLGEYVYHEGYYYKVTVAENWSVPALGAYGYQRLGIEYINIAYPVQSIVSYNNQYYIAVNAVSTGNTPGSSANWRLINHRGNYMSTTTYNRYDSIIYNGKRYFWNNPTATINTNPETTSGWWSLEENWDFKNTYVQDSIVSYNNDLYILRTGTSQNQIPGVSGAWQPLSLKWSSTAMYYRLGSKVSIVEHEGKYYIWYGNHDTTNTSEPGTGRNGWNELTDVWVSTNRYLQGDFVIYDGSFWELLLPTNPTDQTNVPGIDFTVWKEHPIEWNPNRN
jgi:hypothetical protein